MAGSQDKARRPYPWEQSCGGEPVVRPLEALSVSLRCQGTSVGPYTTVGVSLMEQTKIEKELYKF